MVTLTRAGKLRSTQGTACRAAGFLPRIAAETSDLGVVVELPAEPAGIAVLPASGLAGPAGPPGARGGGRGRMDPAGPRPPPPRPPHRAGRRPATSPPAARAFLTLAREHLAPPPGST